MTPEELHSRFNEIVGDEADWWVSSGKDTGWQADSWRAFQGYSDEELAEFRAQLDEALPELLRACRERPDDHTSKCLDWPLIKRVTSHRLNDSGPGA